MYEELVKSLRTDHDKYFARDMEAADAIEELKKKLYFQDITTAQILEMYMPFFIPKWIPVTERLPPAEKEVYVTDGEYIARANLLDEVFPGDKPCWSYSGLGEITHWCERIPLPQPLKEERVWQKNL